MGSEPCPGSNPRKSVSRNDSLDPEGSLLLRDLPWQPRTPRRKQHKGHAESRTRDGPRIQDPGPRTQNPGPRTQKPERPDPEAPITEP